MRVEERVSFTVAPDVLHLFDPAPSLSARPDYAIRLANDLWESSTGFNDLHHTVVVSP